MEEWREIPGFSLYHISTAGLIYNVSLERFLEGSEDEHGYTQFSLFDDEGKKKVTRLHRLLGLIFLDNPDALPVVDHKDRNKRNNTLENLRWVSKRDNTLNSDQVGRPKK